MYITKFAILTTFVQFSGILFTMLYCHHPYSHNFLITPNRHTVPTKPWLPIFPFLNPFFVSLNLPFLGISCT